MKATIAKWIADLNKGDMRSIVAACASHTAIVDGFPPFAWQTCADWMNDYEANNKTIQGTPGILEIGQSIHEELHGKDLSVFTLRHFPTRKTANRSSTRAP